LLTKGEFNVIQYDSLFWTIPVYGGFAAVVLPDDNSTDKGEER
jgi:hypothetical protein